MVRCLSVRTGEAESRQEVSGNSVLWNGQPFRP